MDEEPQLIVDSREKENVRKILDSYGIKYKIEALPVGDYVIRTPDGEVTVERKTMTDFIGSLFSGRLEEQMRKLSEKKCPILLITGNFEEYRRHAKTTKFTADQVIGAIASCIVKYGLRSTIWIQGGHTMPHATGIALCTKLIRKIADGKLDQIPPRRLKPRDGASDQEEMLHLICGVPIDVSKNLLYKFKTVRATLNANDEDLLSVKGMGRTRIKKMRCLLGDI